MVTIKINKEKNNTCISDVTLDNASIYEILTALDIVLDTLENYDVSKLAVIDYVLNRANYVDKKEEK